MIEINLREDVWKEKWKVKDKVKGEDGQKLTRNGKKDYQLGTANCKIQKKKPPGTA